MISCRCVILTIYCKFTLLRLSQNAVFADALFFSYEGSTEIPRILYPNTAYFIDECPFYNGGRHGNLPSSYVKWPVTSGQLLFFNGESPSISGFLLL